MAKVKRGTIAFEAIENAHKAVRDMGADGVLMISFKHGNMHNIFYNPGKDKRNDYAIKAFLKSCT